MKRYHIIVRQGAKILREASVLDEGIAKEEYAFRVLVHQMCGWKVTGVDGGTTLLKKGRWPRTVLFLTEDM